MSKRFINACVKGENGMTFDKGDKRTKAVRNNRKIENMVNLWEIGEEIDPRDVLGSYRGRPYDADDLTPEQDADE